MSVHATILPDAGIGTSTVVVVNKLPTLEANFVPPYALTVQRYIGTKAAAVWQRNITETYSLSVINESSPLP